MHGFFTTIPEWSNDKSFCRFLTRTYKKRWNIETGFKMLNSIHESFRNRSAVKQLIQIYLRGIVYNSWQFWRKGVLKESITGSDGGLSLYLGYLTRYLWDYYLGTILDRLLSLPTNRMEVYFK